MIPLQIVVFREGCVVEEGAYASLLKANGDFAKLMQKHVADLDATGERKEKKSKGGKGDGDDKKDEKKDDAAVRHSVAILNPFSIL